jgi:sigma-B regulation protein RsbU (phosphoserine phosphatase)
VKRAALLALLAIVCAHLHAQSFSLTTGRQPIASLDGLWRFHAGDNPAWASPGFDDSAWPLIRSDQSWTAQGYPDVSGYAWYRFKIQVPSDGRPVGLLLTEILNGYQIYADGKLIGSAGSALPTFDPVIWASPATYRLPAGSGGTQFIQIALRVWASRPLAFWSGAGPANAGNAAGDPGPLEESLRSHRAEWLQEFVNEYAGALFSGLVGLAILAFFLLRPGDKEYLWFSLLLLSQCVNAALHIRMNLGLLPFPLWYSLALALQVLEVAAAITFFSIVLHIRRSFLWWTVLLLAAASLASAALVYFQWARVGIAFALQTVCLAPAYAWIVAALLLGAFRKDVSARLLVVPVALFYGLDLFDLVARMVWQLTGSISLPTIDTTLLEWPYPTSLGDVVTFVFILALLVFLVRRFSLARKEEERLAGEFEAARTVQSLLIPAAPPATPGFTLENVYLPAQEVGGDFFQILPGDDGSLLVVVGDVSGKGLKAAMTVSAIVGALRGCTLRAPAEVLAYLNRVLHGQIGGLVTCCVASITLDGAVTIANAGHLPPYRNGQELALAGGLPLGITADGVYEEEHFTLAPADRLTFLSDGIPEARNPQGQLFGFERTQAISTQSAASIARAAQHYGQEDDITVLTLTLAPSTLSA